MENLKSLFLFVLMNRIVEFHLKLKIEEFIVKSLFGPYIQHLQERYTGCSALSAPPSNCRYEHELYSCMIVGAV